MILQKKKIQWMIKKKLYNECVWLVKKSFRFCNSRRKNKILTYILLIYKNMFFLGNIYKNMLK